MSISSKFLTLDGKDFFKGLFVSVLTAVLTAFLTILQNGLPITWKNMVPVIYAGGAALISYLLKNLLTNSDGELLTFERK